jgi:uncharacterized damage-inducible protein DinB
METHRIADMIERLMTGDPWHGPNVASTLEGISAADAARRPAGGAHSIWELVLHMTGWAREVTARLEGRDAQEPEGGDWPAAGTGDDAWQHARAALFAAHDDLVRQVRRLPDDALGQPVRDYRDNALGTGLSRYLTLHGLIHHTCYHAGQIAMLRRLLG